MDLNFSELRKQLPYHYAKLISEKLDNVGSEQVRLVFRGEITNPVTVEKVFTEALKLKAQLGKLNKLKRRVSKVK